MSHIQRLLELTSSNTANDAAPGRRYPLLLVVEDGEEISSALQPICEFLEVVVECLPSHRNLAHALQLHGPMGVVAHMDSLGQDGCHVMKTVAAYDRSLPLMLITGDEPALAGAADAVEELWQLESVVRSCQLPSVAATVDFLFRAGRMGQCMRLLPV